MPSCCFNRCKNHSGKEHKSSGITFHAFPKDELMRHRWLLIVRNQRQEFDWKATNNSRVCSSHFKSDDIYITENGLRRIKKGATPFIPLATVIISDSSGRNSPNSLSNMSMSESDSIFDTPTEAILKQKIKEMSIKNKKLSMENKNLKRRNKRLKNKSLKLKEALQKFKKKSNAAEDQFNELSLKEEVVELYQKTVLNNKRNKNTRIEFTPNLRKFAVKLHSYSPAGYKYVRRIFQNSLPHPRTLEKWHENTPTDKNHLYNNLTIKNEPPDTDELNPTVEDSSCDNKVTVTVFLDPCNMNSHDKNC